MSVVKAVRIVVADHPAIVALMQIMVYVGKVVAGHFTGLVNPHLASQFAVPSALRDGVPVVINFSVSHDALYHGCSLWPVIEDRRMSDRELEVLNHPSNSGRPPHPAFADIDQ